MLLHVCHLNGFLFVDRADPELCAYTALCNNSLTYWAAAC